MRVDLQPDLPSRTERFERERGRLADALSAQAMTLHHFGSTSVRALDAKPIVDIKVARSTMQDYADAESAFVRRVEKEAMLE